MITLEGLTKAQVKLCDSIWACDTMDDVEQYISSLTPKVQKQARALQMLMLAAVCDEEVTDETHCDQARRLLEGLK